MITYEIYFGHEVLNYLSIVSQMRMAEFKNYPYLYVGDNEYEKEYIKGFAKNSKSCLVVAKELDLIVGITTAMPLTADSTILKDVDTNFAVSGDRPEDFYYFGEFIVIEKYRGFEISRQMEQLTLEQAKKWNFTFACLATVIRSPHDAREPANFFSTDSIWVKRGYKKTNLILSYHWPTKLKNGDISDETNELAFWKKPL